MEKNKPKNVTKKLQDLVKDRKIGVVVTKQGSIKRRSSPSDESVESYCYSNYNS